MSFNPLGKFQIDAVLNTDAVSAGKNTLSLLRSKYPCPAGSIKRPYGHWTVGHYNQDFPDYNLAVGFDGQHFHIRVVGNPQDNASGVPSRYHSHTYERNGHALGIATDDMAFANEHDFGPEPITLMTAEFFCAAIAAAGAAYSIDLSALSTDSPYAGEPNFLTHAEAANRPGSPAQYANYYVTGERWDWATMVPFPAGMSNKDIDPGIVGNALRHRAHLYKVAML